MIQPREVAIYCGSHKTVAWFDAVLRLWKCGRCGAKVKVTW